MVYGLSIFLSAFLLFQIQLITAKHLLPWFGGTPAVWTTCQVFFQIVLLGGYAYAHFIGISRWSRHQGRIHFVLLIVTLIGMGILGVWGGIPLLAPASMKPTGNEQPIPLLLITLLVTVGLPFFTLSATGPLLQRWHSLTAAPLATTYRLYALSNAGSLLGLISYPVGFERMLDLHDQAWSWISLFVVFAIGCGYLAVKLAHSPIADSSLNPSTSISDEEESRTNAVQGKWRPWLWTLLAFTSSAMSLGTTNQLCQEVAVVPLLWVLPLGIYLSTFIVCFDKPRWYSRRWFTLAAAVLSILILPNSTSAAISVLRQIIVYSLFLTCFCMICHGELMRLRPGASKLTQYYLLIATGGALGGTFVSLIAPVIFTGLWEFHVTILVGWVVFSIVWLQDPTSPLRTGDRWFFALLVSLLCIVGCPFLIGITPLRNVGWIVHHGRLSTLTGGLVLATLVCAYWWRSTQVWRRIWPRGLICVVIVLSTLFLVQRISFSRSNTVLSARNFFGIVRIIALKDQFDQVRAYQLLHGITSHGMQYTDPQAAQIPTTYYSPSSGIGIAATFLTHLSHSGINQAQGGLRFGILGLGVGTIATYARSGDHVRFYEIDPIIVDASTGVSPYFTFLRDCPGEVSVELGDARLSLERELAKGVSQQFDLLAVDAFSGDAIPVHLLTEEAFRVYAAHLRNDDSIIAINISNRYLRLEPVVAASALRLGFHGVRIESIGDRPRPEPSTWLLLARNPALFDRPAFRAGLPLAEERVLFTDQYSNLFRVLR